MRSTISPVPNQSSQDIQEHRASSAAVVVSGERAPLQQLQLPKSASSSAVAYTVHAYAAHAHLACDPFRRPMSTLSYRPDQLMSARFTQLSEYSSSSSLRRLSALHTASPDVCHQVASSRSYNTHVVPTSVVSSMPARFAKTTRHREKNCKTGSASSSAVVSPTHVRSALDPRHVLSSPSCWQQVVPACSVMSQLWWRLKFTDVVCDRGCGHG